MSCSQRGEVSRGPGLEMAFRLGCEMAGARMLRVERVRLQAAKRVGRSSSKGFYSNFRRRWWPAAVMISGAMRRGFRGVRGGFCELRNDISFNALLLHICHVS